MSIDARYERLKRELKSDGELRKELKYLKEIEDVFSVKFRFDGRTLRVGPRANVSDDLKVHIRQHRSYFIALVSLRNMLRNVLKKINEAPSKG